MSVSKHQNEKGITFIKCRYGKHTEKKDMEVTVKYM